MSSSQSVGMCFTLRWLFSCCEAWKKERGSWGLPWLFSLWQRHLLPRRSSSWYWVGDKELWSKFHVCILGRGLDGLCYLVCWEICSLLKGHDLPPTLYTIFVAFSKLTTMQGFSGWESGEDVRILVLWKFRCPAGGLCLWPCPFFEGRCHPSHFDAGKSPEALAGESLSSMAFWVSRAGVRSEQSCLFGGIPRRSGLFLPHPSPFPRNVLTTLFGGLLSLEFPTAAAPVCLCSLWNSVLLGAETPHHTDSGPLASSVVPQVDFQQLRARPGDRGQGDCFWGEGVGISQECGRVGGGPAPGALGSWRVRGNHWSPRSLAYAALE